MSLDNTRFKYITSTHNVHAKPFIVKVVPVSRSGLPSWCNIKNTAVNEYSSIVKGLSETLPAAASGLLSAMQRYLHADSVTQRTK